MSQRAPSRRRKSVFATIIPLVVILATLAGLVVDFIQLGPIGQNSAQAAPEARSIPYTDINPYGVNVFLQKEVEDWKKEKTLQMIKDAGIGWIKQEFPWNEIEFKKGYFFDDKWGKNSWEKYDNIVALAEKYNLQIIARIDRAPDWARPSGSNAGAPPTDYQDYADFVKAFVDHYKGRIRYLQIWNEPNLHDEWLEGTPVDPARYTDMLKSAYEAAKAADPTIVILSAPMAMTTENDPGRRNLNELIYIDEMYQAGAKDYFDIMSANGYGLEYAPDAPADPNVLNFQRVSLIHDIMKKYGDDGKAVWLNEYGWNASPADMSPEKLIWRRVTEQQQADYTVQGIEQGRKDWPWLGVVAIWYFRQVGDITPAQSEYYFGMVDPEFMTRPVYNAVKDAATKLRVAETGLYQESNPAITKTGTWINGANQQVYGKTFIRSSEPGAKLTFKFKGTDLNLLTRVGPDGGIAYVTIDGKSDGANALKKDAQGRAYIDLYSKEKKWQQEIAITSGLGAQFPTTEHTFTLEVAPTANPESSGTNVVVDALGVANNRSFTLFYGIAGGLIVVMLAAAAWWRLALRP